MSILNELQARSHDKCELCGSADGNTAYLIPNSPGSDAGNHVFICTVCKDQIEGKSHLDENHWRCLNEGIWSEEGAVQVMSWRMLHQLQQFDWAVDLLGMAYLEDERLAWAKMGIREEAADGASAIHVDCYGAPLQKGDAVVLVKTLDVKGATFSAKMGTVVRNIRLVEDNPEQIEGKVNGSQIVILTKYVRKSNPKE
jgi:protein PhnA